jgi:UPF0176 protein
MAVLHNRVSQKELKARLYQETEPRTTLSFYRYFPISDPQRFRDGLYMGLNVLKVFGRIYIAKEGINAQISVPQSRFDAMKGFLYSVTPDGSGVVSELAAIPADAAISELVTIPSDAAIPELVAIPDDAAISQSAAIPGSAGPLHGVRLNVAVDDDGRSFWVLKIKVRDKIVADGIDDPTFDMGRKGNYVDAKDFNRLTEDPDTIVVDMRNHYEYEVGHFEDAIEVPSDTFREQLPMSVDMLQEDKDRNIIMYCTGGIRCEKASAYLLHKGFRNVFHLEGGIIHYSNTVKEQGLENKFKGKNFVFDDRLGERISTEIIARCHQCGQPADTHTNCRNEGCHLLFIQCAACAARYEGCCSESCRSIIHLPPEDQKRIRKGIDKGAHIFNKAKARLPSKLDP